MAFKEPGDSLAPLHKPAIGPYLQQDLFSLQDHSPPTSNPFLILSSHLRLGLTKGLFISVFPTKILYALLDCSIRATCPTHPSHLDLRFLIMLGEEYNE